MGRMHFGMILTKALTQSLENDQELIKLIKCNDPMKSYNDQVLWLVSVESDDLALLDELSL